MKVSSVLSIFLRIAAVSMTSVSARAWKFGDGGLVRWDNDCDFNGYDISRQSSSGERCGGMCIENSRCTHFTYVGGTCYLKRNVRGFFEVCKGGHTCGFIPGRSSQSLGQKIRLGRWEEIDRIIRHRLHLKNLCWKKDDLLNFHHLSLYLTVIKRLECFLKESIVFIIVMGLWDDAGRCA